MQETKDRRFKSQRTGIVEEMAPKLIDISPLLIRR